MPKVILRTYMPPSCLKFPSQDSLRKGTTLAEVVVSTLLTSVVIVGALNGVSLIHRSSDDSELKRQFRYHAAMLLEEIGSLHYEEPDWTEESERRLGRDSGESTSDRRTWDDIDDAHGWVSNPLTQRDGASLINTPQPLKARAWVNWVTPQTLEISNEETGLKRVQIRVLRKGDNHSNAPGLEVYGYFSNNSLASGRNSASEVIVTDTNGQEIELFINPLNGATLP